MLAVLESVIKPGLYGNKGTRWTEELLRGPNTCTELVSVISWSKRPTVAKPDIFREIFVI